MIYRPLEDSIQHSNSIFFSSEGRKKNTGRVLYRGPFEGSVGKIFFLLRLEKDNKIFNLILEIFSL